MTTCFLVFGNEYLDDAKKFHSIAAAKEEYLSVARQLDRYGQRIDGRVHIARTRDEVVEYPDYVLSLGPHGGLKVERT